MFVNEQGNRARSFPNSQQQQLNVKLVTVRYYDIEEWDIRALYKTKGWFGGSYSEISRQFSPRENNWYHIWKYFMTSWPQSKFKLLHLLNWSRCSAHCLWSFSRRSSSASTWTSTWKATDDVQGPTSLRKGSRAGEASLIYNKFQNHAFPNVPSKLVRNPIVVRRRRWYQSFLGMCSGFQQGW